MPNDLRARLEAVLLKHGLGKAYRYAPPFDDTTPFLVDDLLALVEAGERVVEAAGNVLLVASEERRTRLNGEQVLYVGTGLLEVKQLRTALTAYRTVQEGE